jgi:hypothetical protein
MQQKRVAPWFTYLLVVYLFLVDVGEKFYAPDVVVTFHADSSFGEPEKM